MAGCHAPKVSGRTWIIQWNLNIGTPVNYDRESWTPGARRTLARGRVLRSVKLSVHVNFLMRYTQTEALRIFPELFHLHSEFNAGCFWAYNPGLIYSIK